MRKRISAAATHRGKLWVHCTGTENRAVSFLSSVAAAAIVNGTIGAVGRKAAQRGRSFIVRRKTKLLNGF